MFTNNMLMMMMTLGYFCCRCVELTIRPMTHPVSSLPQSADLRGPKRATDFTWSTLDPANVRNTFDSTARRC